MAGELHNSLIKTDILPVPISAEAGLPQFQIRNWYVLAAPAAMPPPIVDRLNMEPNKVMQ